MYMYPRPGVGRPRPFFLDRDDMTRGRGTRTKRRSRAADRVVHRHPRIQGTYVSVDSTRDRPIGDHASWHHASCVVDTVTLGVHGARKKKRGGSAAARLQRRTYGRFDTALVSSA